MFFFFFNNKNKQKNKQTKHKQHLCQPIQESQTGDINEPLKVVCPLVWFYPRRSLYCSRHPLQLAGTSQLSITTPAWGTVTHGLGVPGWFQGKDGQVRVGYSWKKNSFDFHCDWWEAFTPPVICIWNASSIYSFLKWELSKQNKSWVMK